MKVNWDNLNFYFSTSSQTGFAGIHPDLESSEWTISTTILAEKAQLFLKMIN